MEQEDLWYINVTEQNIDVIQKWREEEKFMKVDIRVIKNISYVVENGRYGESSYEDLVQARRQILDKEFYEKIGIKFKQESSNYLVDFLNKHNIK